MSYVNFNNKLEDQKINQRYYTVYTAGGAHIAAAVIDTNALPDFIVNKVKIKSMGFIPDVKTFYYSTNNKEEAYYLVSVLNSNFLDDKIKKDQTKGKFGPRDIHRRPFEYNIPIYNKKDELHTRLYQLGIICTKEAEKLKKTSRMKIKNQLKELDEIDEIVKNILE